MASDPDTGEDIAITGKLKKQMFLQDAKYINDSMETVVRARGRTISGLKSLYNKKQLASLGYTYESSIAYKAVSNALLLQFMKNTVNSDIDSVGSMGYSYMNETIYSKLYLQDTYGYSVTTNKILYTDGKEYEYIYSVNNSNLIDIFLVTSYEDTMIPYLDATYTLGYMIISAVTSPQLLGGQYKYTAEIEYQEDDGVGGTNTVAASVEVEADGLYLSTTSVFHQYIADIVTNGSRTENIEVLGTYSDDGGTQTFVKATYTVTTTVVYVESLEFNVLTSSVFVSGSNSTENRTIAEDTLKGRVVSEIAMQVDDIVQNGLEHIVFNYTLNGISYLGALKTVDHTELITTKESDVLPNIALKLGGEFTESTRKQQAVLNKIGMASDDFTDSLSDSKLSDAYISFTFNVWEDTPLINKVLFETFDGLVVGAYEQAPKSSELRTSSFSFKMGVEMAYAADVTDRIVVGSIGEIGTYTREEVIIPAPEPESVGSDADPEPTYPTYQIVLKRQDTEDYYSEIVIAYLRLDYKVGGSNFTYSNQAATKDRMLRMIVVKDIVATLPFNEYCDLLETTLSILSYAVVVVKTKWYQSGFFGALMLAAALVVSVTTGQWYIFAAAVGFRIAAQFLDPKILAVAAIVYTALTFDPSNLASTASGVLATANALVTMVSSISSLFFSIDMEKMARQVQREKDEEKEATKELQELLDKQGSAINTLGIGTKDIDSYYDIALGNYQYNYDILYDIDSVVTTNYA